MNVVQALLATKRHASRPGRDIISIVPWSKTGMVGRVQRTAWRVRVKDARNSRPFRYELLCLIRALVCTATISRISTCCIRSASTERNPSCWPLCIAAIRHASRCQPHPCACLVCLLDGCSLAIIAGVSSAHRLASNDHSFHLRSSCRLFSDYVQTILDMVNSI